MDGLSPRVGGEDERVGRHTQEREFRSLGRPGVRTGAEHVALGWRLLWRSRLVVAVAVALGVMNALGPHLLRDPGARGSSGERSAHTAEKRMPSPAQSQRHWHLLEPYDPLKLLPAVPELRVPGMAGISRTAAGSRSPALAVILGGLLEWSIAALVAAAFAGMLVAFASPPLPAWRAAACHATRDFVRYLILGLVVALPKAMVSVGLASAELHLSTFEVTGIWAILCTFLFPLALAPLIVTVDNASLLRATWLSVRTTFRRLPEAATVVLGIGFLQFGVTGPATRAAFYVVSSIAWPASRDAIPFAFELLSWSVYALIGAWFCLSVIGWWIAIRSRELGCTPGPGQNVAGCSTL